jgi:dTMP kinase
VLFLHIGARDPLARKGEFSSLETGHSGGSDEDFIRYQDTVLATLREHGQRGGWLSMDVTDMDRDAVFTTAANALADRFQFAL